MNSSEYNFKRCKLCGTFAAQATYDLKSSIIYVCQHCDFHFLNHLDHTPEKNHCTIQLNIQNRKYLDSRADENASLHLSRLTFMQSHISLSGAKVLDIGAGLGQFHSLLRTQGAESHGIEPSDIRREYAQQQSGIQLQSELVDDNYWQTSYVQYFDAMTLWDVIEHVNFPKETIESACRLLKTGGILFLDTPSRESLSYGISQKFYRYMPGKMSLFLPSFYSTAPYGHKQIFTPSQLSDLFESSGLEIIFSSRSYTNRLFSSHKIILAGRKV
ncbi:class I SAM-dependent methyltransferase [uncultured Desulfuromusa sp.]|uniref:class I SAM-dependent methyltransferase n=1 Tax=uncultured Desulfuromusa sp. TaxID=219183 RepID=UPI002AA90139|nr:class I SAM-dependent methyltransferase [uncultured Desulfuromusa sp.]